jgi:hypothetical protein
MVFENIRFWPFSSGGANSSDTAREIESWCARRIGKVLFYSRFLCGLARKADRVPGHFLLMRRSGAETARGNVVANRNG